MSKENTALKELQDEIEKELGSIGSELSSQESIENELKSVIAEKVTDSPDDNTSEIELDEQFNEDELIREIDDAINLNKIDDVLDEVENAIENFDEKDSGKEEHVSAFNDEELAQIANDVGPLDSTVSISSGKVCSSNVSFNGPVNLDWSTNTNGISVKFNVTQNGKFNFAFDDLNISYEGHDTVQIVLPGGIMFSVPLKANNKKTGKSSGQAA